MKIEKSSDVTNYVQITMADGDKIVIELMSEFAPITVSNFKNLVSQKFYNGLIFHRVINNFMIQGGDPTGTGMGGAPDKIKGEFAQNGVRNDLAHTKGVISMARSQFPNSASSQFFICHTDCAYLDGSYASFGKVISGMEVVDKIAQVKTMHNDKPVTEQKMHTVEFVNCINE